MSESIEQAELFLDRGEYTHAFNVLRKITLNPVVTNRDIADAYQMMGNLVQVSPSLGSEDECGLSYFKKSLHVFPNHLWSLFGVIASFGERFPDHQDIAATLDALARIKEFRDLSIKMIDTIEKKQQLVQRMQSSQDES